MPATPTLGLKSRGHGPLLQGTMRDRVLRATATASAMNGRGHGPLLRGGM